MDKELLPKLEGQKSNGLKKENAPSNETTKQKLKKENQY